MNPFDLRGPEFLGFFVGLGVAAFLLYLLRRAISNQGGEPGELPTDPYVVAHLRGGLSEALRTALVTLFAEGAIVRAGLQVMAPTKKPPRRLVPFEVELWPKLQKWRALDDLVWDGVGKRALAESQARLERMGYVRTERQLGLDRAVRLGLAAVVVAAGVAKILIAIERGHTNVGFLVILCIAVAMVAILKPAAITSRGRRALVAAQELLKGVRKKVGKVDDPPQPHELGMVMAAFGLPAFLTADYPFLIALGLTENMRAAALRTGQGGSSCGAGGSCGSSCGGGCGGGGCGGCGS